MAEPGYARPARWVGTLLTTHRDHCSGGAVPVPLVTEVGEPTAHVPVHVVGADDRLLGQAPARG